MKCRSNNLINKIKENKILVLSIIFSIILVAFVTIPTLSEYKNTNPTYTITTWDGTISTSYADGDGSLENPYIISNGSELAYFASQLETNNYEGKYFILNKDIVLNIGRFSYTKTDGIKYVEDDEEIVITPNLEENPINVFKHLNGFKGTFDGKNYTIYGLYIDEAIEGQNALFTNLEGTISNLNIKNSIIYGGKITAGVASIAKKSTLTNISYNGFVISDKEIDNEVLSAEIGNITKTVSNLEYIDNLNINDFGYIPGVITEITLSGNYQTDNKNAILKINDEVINEGEFKVNLKLQPTIPINYQTNTESNFSLNNLKYEIKYNYSNAAGIVSIAENTTLKNIINKASVFASVYASGIINTISGQTLLENTYNTGNIESAHTSSGLISNINQNKENVTITNCYNDGNLVSNNNAMIGNIENNTGNVNITNIFNIQDNYGINLIESSTVNINNSYSISNKTIKTGQSNGGFIQTTEENLKNKDFIQKNLKFEEYNETENIENSVWKWIFETNSLPILYIDDLNKPIANIHIKDYVWDNPKNEVETLKFSNKLVFSIEEIDELNRAKEINYIIRNEKNTLTKEELDAISEWNSYNEIVEINEEGFYIIYVKVIDDNNNEFYINTDLLVIDLTGSNVTISTSFTDKKWKTLRTNIENYYIDREISIEIEAEDLLSGINKIYYYMSDTLLSKEELEKIENWNEYTEKILVTSKETIVYAKVIDNCDYSTYANSDLFVLNGYTLDNISAGTIEESKESIYISNKSNITLNFTYLDSNEYAEGSKHQVVSNILLPQNTKITLIDKTNSKVYSYITTNSNYGYDECDTDNCEAIYDFELFDEIGTTNKFQEMNYNGQINEKFTVIVDFSNTQINKNIEDISITLKINNEKTTETRNTLYNSIKKFNIIYDNSGASFTLTTTFNETINYNENKKHTIDFLAKINYKTLEDNIIYDTTFEDKKMGLAIKMVNSDGLIVDKQNLKNIVFKIGEKKYSPSNDGIVRINLEKETSSIEDNLIIETYSDNYNLKEGNYKFIITLYTAYDGMYSNEEFENIEIPVYVGVNNSHNADEFNVIMSNEDKIITTNTNEFNFEFILSQTYQNPNIKISLYKKDSLSAYDQKYSIVDLENYIIDNSFEKYNENIYYAVKEQNNNIKINLNTSLLEKNGYMFVFELYDGEKLVNRINKKFIVK